MGQEGVEIPRPLVLDVSSQLAPARDGGGFLFVIGWFRWVARNLMWRCGRGGLLERGNAIR